LGIVTRSRRGGLDDKMPRCRQAATRKARDDFWAALRELNSQDDHVHLPAEYPPKAAVSPMVNSLKGVSARRPPDR
jgi:putative transposase